MKWIFIIISILWLMILLFVGDVDNTEHGIFFVGIMVIYLFVDKLEKG